MNHQDGKKELSTESSGTVTGVSTCNTQTADFLAFGSWLTTAAAASCRDRLSLLESCQLGMQIIMNMTLAY
jgi:hypothetical protein